MRGHPSSRRFLSTPLIACWGAGGVACWISFLPTRATTPSYWLSALLVGVVLFAGAGVVALVGKKEIQQATPPAPEQAIEGVKEDIAVMKGDRA